MQTKHPMGSLSPGDCHLMDSHLTASLEILDNAGGRPSPALIQMKSLLTVLRSEIRQALGLPVLLEPDYAG